MGIMRVGEIKGFGHPEGSEELRAPWTLGRTRPMRAGGGAWGTARGEKWLSKGRPPLSSPLYLSEHGPTCCLLPLKAGLT